MSAKETIARVLRGAGQGLAVEDRTILRVTKHTVGSVMPVTPESQSAYAQRVRFRMWAARVVAKGAIVDHGAGDEIQLLPETVGYTRSEQTAEALALAELARRNQPGLPPLRHGGRLVEEEVTG